MEHFGDYILLEKISSGGMADIFKAAKLGSSGFFKLLAVKRIKDHIAQDPAFQEMFIQEAHVQASFSHPHVVNIFDFGQVDGKYFIAMEYLNGRPLRTMIQMLRLRNERLRMELILYILESMLKGLDYIHNLVAPDGTSMNIVHRDLDPRNIFLNFSGEIKLIDFGISGAEAPAGAGDEETMLKGKFSYMAPELLEGGAADRAVDIFGTGLVFYELLTLRRLFSGDNEEEILEQILHLDIPQQLDALPVDQDIKDILVRALDRDPGARYPSASAFLHDLRGYQQKRGVRVSSNTFRSLMDHLFQEEQQEELRKNQFYFSILKDREMADDDHTQVITRDEVPPPGQGETTEQAAGRMDAPGRDQTDGPEPVPGGGRRLLLPVLLGICLLVLAGVFFLSGSDKPAPPEPRPVVRPVRPPASRPIVTDQARPQGGDEDDAALAETAVEEPGGRTFTPSPRKEGSLEGEVEAPQADEAMLTARIEVSGTPVAQDVYLDEHLEGRLPLVIRARPGFHSIECRMEGYWTHHIRVRALAGQTLSVECVLRRKDAGQRDEERP